MIAKILGYGVMVTLQIPGPVIPMFESGYPNFFIIVINHQPAHWDMV